MTLSLTYSTYVCMEFMTSPVTKQMSTFKLLNARPVGCRSVTFLAYSCFCTNWDMYGGMHTRMHALTHARTHACTHACTHSRTHARTHAHTQISSLVFVLYTLLLLLCNVYIYTHDKYLCMYTVQIHSWGHYSFVEFWCSTQWCDVSCLSHTLFHFWLK